jgi:hypothetical protein
MPKPKREYRPEQDEFVAWLQSELDRRNWTLGEAQRQTRIGKNVFHYWLNGREPSFASICVLSDAFGKDPMSICRMLLNRHCL